MTETNDLYKEVILEHNKKPRNFGKLSPASHSAEGYNPLCGDHLWVYLQVGEDQRIAKVMFEGAGCAISKASASMMTVALTGKTVDEAKDIFKQFHALLLGQLKPETDAHSLGKLKIFSGIWEYPARVKCAALAWHAVHGALNSQASVSTE
ncbi:iron-sulfur cluster assembly scaffold protein, partial [Planctomyces bekefii]